MIQADIEHNKFIFEVFLNNLQSSKKSFLLKV